MVGIRRHHRGLIFFIFIGLAALSIAAGRAEKEREPSRIAVLDMWRIFTDYEKAARYDVELERLVNELTADREKREKALEQIDAEIKELAPGSQAREDKQIELTRKAIDLKYWGRSKTKELNEKRLAYSEEVEADLRKVAEQIAEKRGFDLILNNDRAANEDLPPEERRVPIIIYARDAIDITDEVLRVLNPPPKKEEGDPSKGSPPQEEKE